jgi:hypothetical protein
LARTRNDSARRLSRGVLALACAGLIAPGDAALLSQEPTPVPSAPEQAKLPADQLDSLVAPIALYPDPLLAQTLAASTYPLEIIQLQQWLAKNPDLKDKALADALAKQPWDPSVQSMAAFPDLVKRLADDVSWTADLGNAFLAQQSDVMDAVQRMRKKAKDKGTLTSNEQQKVETEVVQKKEVIVIQPSNPDVIYVPSYSPSVVYGPPIYPYPSIYYPYYPVGAAFISFGVGFAMGAFWGGVWGGCGWGGNTININNNNNFNRVEHRGGDRGQGNRGQGNRGQGNRGQGGGNWSHNPQHRGGTPYGDRATANKFGGNARGDSLASRQAGARQRASQSSARTGAGNRGGAGVSNRAGGAGGGRGAGASGGAGRGGGGNQSFNRGGSADRIGSRDLGGGGSRGGGGGFGGGSSGGFSGSRSRASSSRGSSSFGGRGGGGGRRR